MTPPGDLDAGALGWSFPPASPSATQPAPAPAPPVPALPREAAAAFLTGMLTGCTRGLSVGLLLLLTPADRIGIRDAQESPPENFPASNLFCRWRNVCVQIDLIQKKHHQLHFQTLSVYHRASCGHTIVLPYYTRMPQTRENLPRDSIQTD